ncbi:MAG: ATP synthase F1 subunit gamma [Bdellovibrionaceae bacterium]|nr:ATP synthase F1 subunit gamma [Pseudobdellovibrionaceae bacterium]
MPSLKDIRARIDSTKNTQQITSALKLVSASKLKRAQNNIVNLRPYARGLKQLIYDLAATERATHRLLAPRPNPKNLLLVVVTSDRGLCGAFNSNINKFAVNYLKEQKANYDKIDLIFVGKKARDFFARRGAQPKQTITDLARDISYSMAADIAETVLGYYLSGDYDEVRLVYNEFKSAISQVVCCEKLVPIDASKGTGPVEETRFSKDMIIEPPPAEMIDQLVKKYFAVEVYRCLSESVAAEHGARMSAMENATKNAGEMIKSMTLTYNKLRQASITSELIEITTGAEALKG